MNDRRPLVVVVVLVLLTGIGFFVVRSTGGSSVSPSATLLPPAPTTTAAPVSFDTEWHNALSRVTQGENDLFTNPDPSRVGEIMTKDCACYQSTIDRLTALNKAHQHIAGPTIFVHSSTLASHVDSNHVQLNVKIDAVPNSTVDASGKVMSPGPSGSVNLTYNLIKGSDGIWRIENRRPSGKQ